MSKKTKKAAPAATTEIETFEISVAKLEKDFTVSMETMTDATKSFIFRHGLKQLINDAHAGEKDIEAVEAKVSAKIANLHSNLLSARASGDDCHTDYKKIAYDWLVKSTGNNKKTLEAFRKTNGWTTKQLLEIVCENLGEDFTTIDATIQDTLKKSRMEASELASSINLEELLSK